MAGKHGACALSRRDRLHGRTRRGIARGEAQDCVWLLEHPSIYTAGTSADPAELLGPDRFPVFKSGRGGRFTYHGPGQRVAYVMLDLTRRGRDVRAFVTALEDWLIATLARLGVEGERRPGRSASSWRAPRSPASASACGTGSRLHGVSLNVDPELEHFAGIVPCGSGRYASHQPRRARRRDRHGAESTQRFARLRADVR